MGWRVPCPNTAQRRGRGAKADKIILLVGQKYSDRGQILKVTSAGRAVFLARGPSRPARAQTDTQHYKLHPPRVHSAQKPLALARAADFYFFLPRFLGIKTAKKQQIVEKSEADFSTRAAARSRAWRFVDETHAEHVLMYPGHATE
jgi:hypothetical protein